MSSSFNFYLHVVAHERKHTCDVEIALNTSNQHYKVKDIKYYTGWRALVKRLFGQTIAIRDHGLNNDGTQRIFYVDKKQFMNSQVKKGFSQELIQTLTKRSAFQQPGPVSYSHIIKKSPQNRNPDFYTLGVRQKSDLNLIYWELKSRKLEAKDLQPNAWDWLRNDYGLTTDRELRNKIKQNQKDWNLFLRPYGVKNFDDYALVSQVIFDKKLNVGDLKPNPWEYYKKELKALSDDELRDKLFSEIHGNAAKVKYYGAPGADSNERLLNYRLLCSFLMLLGYTVEDLKGHQPNPWDWTKEQYEMVEDEELATHLANRLEEEKQKWQVK